MDCVGLKRASSLSWSISDRSPLERTVGESRTYNEGIQDTNSDPKASPHGVDDRHQGVSCPKSIDTSDELRQTTKDTYERKEDGRRIWITPPLSNVGGGDPCRACETCKTERSWRCDGLQEDPDLWLAVEDGMLLLVVLLGSFDGHPCCVLLTIQGKLQIQRSQ